MACAHGCDAWYSSRLRVAGASSSHARAVSPLPSAAPNADAACAAPASPLPHALSNRTTADTVITRRLANADPLPVRGDPCTGPRQNGEVDVVGSARPD